MKVYKITYKPRLSRSLGQPAKVQDFENCVVIDAQTFGDAERFFYNANSGDILRIELVVEARDKTKEYNT